MKRFQLFFLCALAILGVKGVEIPYQNLTYSISYHCAFIHEQAATANVQISDYGGSYNATLEGRTVPIGGTIYCVNDTLRSTFSASGSSTQPATENVEYIQGYYRKPKAGHPSDPNAPENYKNILGGGCLSADASTMECIHLTADMLCMFYYAKAIDFSQLSEGQTLEVPINMPYGSQRTMQIIYRGVTDYGGTQAYSLLTNFTYDGQFSSYPIEVMISTGTRLPLLFSADIAIGHVNMSLE